MNHVVWEIILASGILVPTIFHALTKLTNSGPIHLIDITIWSIGMTFGLGPLVAFVYGGFDLPFATINTITKQYTAIFLYIGGVFFSAILINLFLRGQRLSLHQITKVIASKDAGVFIIVGVLMWSLRLYLAFSEGVIGVHGVGLLTSSTPYIFHVLQPLTELLYQGVIVWVTLRIFTKKASGLTIPLLLLLAEFVFQFTAGRRDVLFFVGIIVFTVVLYKGRLSTRLFVVSMAAGLGLLLVVFPLYHNFRIHWGSSVDSPAEAVSQIPKAFEDTLSTPEKRRDSIHARNLSQRPLIGRWIGKVSERQKLVQPPGGSIFLRSLVRVIPGFIYPAKYNYMGSSAYLHQYYGLKKTDSANTMPFYLIADFGLLGCLVGGVIYGLFITLLEGLITAYRRRPFLAAAILGSVLLVIFAVEKSPEGIMAYGRNLMIILGTDYAIRLFR